MQDLWQKSINTLKEEGVLALLKKIKVYITMKITNKKVKSECKDILFVNGCFLLHPYRYRVIHQKNQLDANGFTSDIINYDKVKPDIIKKYRAIILYRCPMTREIDELITLAREYHKTLFYDIDDLVIDSKYTDEIAFVKNMEKPDYELYTDGVKRMGETLKKCDYAITTTTDLARELNKYVKEVFINRNVASEEMVALSNKALTKVKKDSDKIILGYFSGSITHNPDFEMIIPALQKIFEKYSNVYLKMVGLISIPESLQKYTDRLIISEFVDYKKLPELIASVDINLAPLENTLFNRCKSENKWLEAALVNVPTIASNMGAFKEVIKDNETGFLCSDKDWFKRLEEIINNEDLRNKVSTRAHDYVIKNYITTYTGLKLKNFIKERLTYAIGFVLPTTNISGGINVILKHASILRRDGNDIFLINSDKVEDDIIFDNQTFGVVSNLKNNINCTFDNLVGSLWTTMDFVLKYHKALKKSYLVQGFETDFMPYGDFRKEIANSTYSLDNINYLTVSKWCAKWLKEDYNQKVKFAPNGLDLSKFTKVNRKFTGKIKILIEGNCDDFFKNVDESFRIVNELNQDDYEITYLSYQGEPKSWYHYDHFYHKVPFSEVAKIYQENDILIKSSIHESFSYPPLEMMATGGLVVARLNDGNQEYLKDKENCLIYDDITSAVNEITTLKNDKQLRQKLITNGEKTAKERAWQNILQDIINLYK